ncbi:hypothetical protein GGF50DRAFT_128019 [Schizophyllum commune]
MNNRLSTAACKKRASSNGSANSVDAIDKKTLEWIEAGLPGLSPDDLRTVLARFSREQDRAKATTATTPAKAANAPVTVPGIAGNAQAQGRNPPVYTPPTTHTQRGGASYYRTTTAPQSGHLPAGQMPTFTYTPPAFAQVVMPPPSHYARVGAQRSETTAARPTTKTGTSSCPLPPTWTGAARPPTGATKAAANAQKNAQPSLRRKVRSGSLERASVQRSAKKAAQAPAPSEA